MKALRRVVTDALGLVPHLLPLADSLGMLRLEPRTPVLAALAVVRSGGVSDREVLHRLIGAMAGLTEGECRGDIDGLTRAERSVVILAMGTVGRPPPVHHEADPPDQHFSPEQIRQLQAVALAVDLGCEIGCTTRLALEAFTTSRFLR